MTTDTLAAPASNRRTALWAYPFRPFFIAFGLYAILAVAGWLGVLLLGWPLNGKFLNMQWHSHEMLFGLVPAAIAGFLLTAMCNWTRSAPLAGARLQALFGLWLAGRVAMWLAGTLPHWLVLIADCAFLFAVAIYAGRVIVGSGNYRNLPLVAVVSAMALANLLFHSGWWNNDFALVRRVELGMVMLIVLLMVIIGGRITPAFTRNWLMRNDLPPEGVKTRPVIETLSVSATALLVLTMLAGAPALINGVVAAVAGTANAVRVAGWRGWKARSDALVWILHAAYAWIPLGLLLLATNQLFGKPLSTVWLHALGPGAMAVLIVAVMTRVAVGHTGRELKLESGGTGIYILIMAAALVRLITALGWLPWRGGLLISSTAWFAAFALFLIVYTPILIAPRADGRPG